MKKILFLIVFLILFWSCDTGTNSNTDDTPDNPPVNNKDDDIPQLNPGTSDILLALYDGNTIRLWDGNIMTDLYTGHVVSAGNRKLALDDVLYYFDEDGGTIHSEWLPVVPDQILVVENEVSAGISARSSVVYEDDVFTLENIPPDEAYALGARYKNYTRIFENGIEIGHWYLNEWECTDVLETASGHILAIDQIGNYHNLTDSKVIETAYQGGIMTYNMGTEEGYIADETGEYHVTWSMNYFDHSRFQKADGVWYTENGYTWTAATGVISNANKMYGWNDWDTYPETYDVRYNERPYLLPAGVHEENSEEVTYWIECNTGQLYRHIHSIDKLEMVSLLYEGPGTREGGIPYFNTLDPEIIGDDLYFHEGGSVKTYNFTTGLISIFSSDQEVISWE